MTKTSIPTIRLNSGYDFPVIGFGTFGGPDAPEKVNTAVKHALKAGYRHIDTAYSYQTEEAVGKAIAESSVEREDLFIVTKLFPTFSESEHVRPVFERQLKLLGVDYVDLYLVHWPFGWKFTGYDFAEMWKGKDENGHFIKSDATVVETYRELEKLVKAGLVKSIGVSNFTIPMLEEVIRECEIPPAVNQVEMHPSLPQEELLQFCKKNGIVVTAYSPLGNPGYGGQPAMMDHPAVLKAAEKYNVNPGQVLLNWGLNRGYTVIPKSVTPERIDSNLVQFKMDDEDVEEIKNIGLEHPFRLFDPKNFGSAYDIFSAEAKK